MNQIQRAVLEEAVSAAQCLLDRANFALWEFEHLPINNQFDDYDRACDWIENMLRNQASDDCEGSNVCGNPTYDQEFIVNGQHHVGTLTVEYDRHDKRYYYIDGTEFTVVPLNTESI